ncbi:hypothetical protein B484DRAFT_468279 [Ochromonadaceae sp. CCMP2298]|nr:hypothetical protein B484DRAFT_468279 [Ochromonadaceae sp. CCMP2298]
MLYRREHKHYLIKTFRQQEIIRRGLVVEESPVDKSQQPPQAQQSQPSQGQWGGRRVRQAQAEVSQTQLQAQTQHAQPQAHPTQPQPPQTQPQTQQTQPQPQPTQTQPHHTQPQAQLTQTQAKPTQPQTPQTQPQPQAQQTQPQPQPTQTQPHHTQPLAQLTQTQAQPTPTQPQAEQPQAQQTRRHRHNIALGREVMELIIDVMCPSKLKCLSALDSTSEAHGRINLREIREMVVLVAGLAYYMAHQVRLCNEAQVFEHKLQYFRDHPDTLGIDVDFAKKYLARSYRESMMEYFGKAGIVWHGCWLFWWSREHNRICCYFVHQILEGCTAETGLTVAQCIRAAITQHTLHFAYLGHKSTIVDSDGAGAYSGIPLSARLPYLAKLTGVKAISLGTGEGGGGKNSMDAQFGVLKTAAQKEVIRSLPAQDRPVGCLRQFTSEVKRSQHLRARICQAAGRPSERSSRIIAPTAYDSMTVKDLAIRFVEQAIRQISGLPQTPTDAVPPSASPSASTTTGSTQQTLFPYGYGTRLTLKHPPLHSTIQEFFHWMWQQGAKGAHKYNCVEVVEYLRLFGTQLGANKFPAEKFWADAMASTGGSRMFSDIQIPADFRARGFYTAISQKHKASAKAAAASVKLTPAQLRAELAFHLPRQRDLDGFNHADLISNLMDTIRLGTSLMYTHELMQKHLKDLVPKLNRKQKAAIVEVVKTQAGQPRLQASASEENPGLGSVVPVEELVMTAVEISHDELTAAVQGIEDEESNNNNNSDEPELGTDNADEDEVQMDDVNDDEDEAEDKIVEME